jgi:BclB C-terminal domain-containing protein
LTGSQGDKGAQGAQGTQGAKGAQGNQGNQGSQGNPGTPGDPGKGAIINFSCQTPLTIISNGTVSAMGSGHSECNITESHMAAPSLCGLSVVIPRDGYITDISMFFHNANDTVLPCQVILRGQLYYSAPGSPLFMSMSGATFDLSPTLSGSLYQGNVCHGIHPSLRIPIAAGSRLLMVISLIAEPGYTTVVSGYCCGGVTIL